MTESRKMDIRIKSREDALSLLAEAAAIEHNLMCCYLYAAFSLKRSVEEDLTEQEVTLVGRWRGAIIRIAIEEMSHLSLVANLSCANCASGVRFAAPWGRAGSAAFRRCAQAGRTVVLEDRQPCRISAVGAELAHERGRHLLQAQRRDDAVDVLLLACSAASARKAMRPASRTIRRLTTYVRQRASPGSRTDESMRIPS